MNTATELYGLRNRAVLVKLSVPGAQSKRKSDKATSDVAARMSADESAITCVVNIMPEEFVKPINTAAGRIRAENYLLTSPWGDDKARLLNIDIMDKHRDNISKLTPDYKDGVARVADNMPAIIQAAKFRLGDAFDESMYPTPQQFIDKMQIKIRYYPIPAGQDFRLDVDRETIEHMRSSLESEMDERVQETINDVKSRMAKVVTSYIERLKKVSNYIDSNGKPRIDGHVRSSIVTNIEDLLDIIPALNITGNQEVDKIADTLRRQLCSWNADTLNDSESVRSAMISRAQQILKEIQG